MRCAKLIKAVFALTLCAAISSASLLSGHYQITNLTYTVNDDGRPQGFNNSGLYIVATDKRIRLVGAFRGIPVSRSLIVEKITGDIMELRDTQDMVSAYKFRVHNNMILGRHRLTAQDGSIQVIESTAIVRKLNQGEIDRLGPVLRF
jgi:hypothetical protein